MVAKLAVVDPPRKQRKPMTGTVLRLKQMMSSTVRPQSFMLPDYPPGVAPKKARMAMDESFSGVNAWANQSSFAAAAAVNYQSAALEGLAFPGYAFLSELAQRPEYRRISEIIATEMTRKWIKITSTSKDDDSKIEQIKIIEAELKRLNVRDCFQKCTELDGYFGRGHLYIDTGSVDDREELKTPIGDGSNDISVIKMAGKTINYLQPTEPVWTYPTAYNSIDPLKQDWYEPSTWFVLGKEIHKTRLLKFVGRQVPDMLKPAYSFGGLSMSQMAIPYVNNWLRTRQSVADIIHSFSVFVLKTDLSESLSEGGEELFQRAEAFNMFRDNKGVFLLDKEGEDFQNISAPLGSLDRLQAQAQEQLSSVSGIPLVKLTGISPSGLNATSEFEMRSFYDWIHAFQEKLYRPNLSIIINMIQLSKIGKIDPDIVFEFEPLWSLDEKGQAEVNQIKSQSGIAMVEAGILSQEEERKRVATDPDSDYSSIDVEDVPELRQEEEQGLEPHGGAAKIAEGAAAQQGEVKPVGEGEGSEDEEGQDDEPFATGELRPDYIDEEAYERNAQPDHPGRGSPKNRKLAEAALKLREKPGYKGELHDDYLEGKNPLLDKNILKERAKLRKEATDDEPMPPVRERKMNPKFLEGKHQTDPDYLKRRSQQRDESAFDTRSTLGFDEWNDVVNDWSVSGAIQHPMTKMALAALLASATWHLANVQEPSVEQAIEHIVENVANAAQIAQSTARSLLSDAIGKAKRKFAHDKATFKENEHPRDQDGQFAEGAGGSGTAPEGNKSETKEAGTNSPRLGTKIVDGKRVSASGEALPEHIQKMKIPPAWTDVTYSTNPKSALQVVGKDSKGRTQSIYSSEHTMQAAASKFARISELNEKFDAIAEQNAQAMASDGKRVRDTADCLALIMGMGIRPGSEADTGASKQAYGATTLQGRHVVRTDAGNIYLRFIGKKGVNLSLKVTDPKLAKMLEQRAKEAGTKGKLFPETSDKILLDYVHSLDGGGFKSKDFRTHLGTKTAFELVNESKKQPANMKDYKRMVREVAKKVSDILGNTPTIALTSYISPTVFAKWQENLT